MTRTLRKTIIKKSKLRYKFSKERNEKIGLITNKNEIITQIFWKNSKHVILITLMLKMLLKTSLF